MSAWPLFPLPSDATVMAWIDDEAGLVEALHMRAALTVSPEFRHTVRGWEALKEDIEGLGSRDRALPESGASE